MVFVHYLGNLGHVRCLHAGHMGLANLVHLVVHTEFLNLVTLGNDRLSSCAAVDYYAPCMQGISASLVLEH